MEDPSNSVLASSCSIDSNLGDIKRHIVDFFKWLNKADRKCTANSSRKEKNELLFLLLQLKKQLSHSISFLNIPPATERQIFLCEICSSKIVLEPLQDIWECLETHCHLNSCVDVSSFKEIMRHGEEHNTSHSHFEPYLNKSFPKEFQSEETVRNTDNDSNSESSADEMSLKESDSTEEYEKSEIAGTSNILSENLSSSSTSDPMLSSDLPTYKSRSWYPINLLKSSENLNTDNQVLDKMSTQETYSDGQALNKKNHRIPDLFFTKAGFKVQSRHSSNSTEDSLKTIEPDRNSFRFKFRSKYSKSTESLLYPKFYHKFDLDGDPILQKTGSERTVCLTCCCELLNQKTPGNIVSHTSGAKHSQTVQSAKMRSIIKNYHDTFLRLDRDYQSHQIYFAPDEEGYLLKCVVCLKYVRCGDVQAHILSELHKTKLIQLSLENKMHSLFYFLDKHVQIYGVKCEASKDTNESGRNERPNRPYYMRHKMVESIDNSDPSWKKFLPGRFTHQLRYLRVMANSVSCTICDDGVNIFSWKNIRFHLVQPSHIESTNTQMLNYLYHCDVCDKKCHDEIAWIIHFDDEYKRHKEAAELKKNDKPLEYECITCKLVLFGDSNAVNKHRLSIPIRRKDKNRATSLSKEVKEFFCSKSTIRENGQKLLDDAESVVSNTDLLIKCCEDLEDALKTKYATCKAYPFGSRISGLGGSHSDLDIFIDIGSMYNGDQNQDERNQTLIITSVLSLIRKRKEFYQINCRPTARTPIIQLKHRTTDLDCDISFVHGLSVENTKFLRYCFELQPVSQTLILLLKKWSHLCVLNENITTYALAMLGIFYLQKRDYLLSVQTIKELNKKNMTIVGWETIDYVAPKEDILKHINIFDGDIIELLIGFFKFYSDFNYKLNVVCPLLGTEIAKDSFSIDPKGGALPKEMHSYVKKINTEKSPEYFRCLSNFCVQDPFDLSHNLTKACSSSLLNKFVKLCNLSHEMLSKLAD